MDLASSQRLNKWWQGLFDKRQERRRRHGPEGIGDVCRRCHRRIGIGTHSYSDPGGFECLPTRLGAPKVVRKSLSKSSRTRTSGR